MGTKIKYMMSMHNHKTEFLKINHNKIQKIRNHRYLGADINIKRRLDAVNRSYY